MKDFSNFVVMYGKNSGTCNVHAAKVYSTAWNKVAVLPLMQIFNSLNGNINKACRVIATGHALFPLRGFCFFLKIV